jgi:tetratricopeptide (TPR) repeat protein
MKKIILACTLCSISQISFSQSFSSATDSLKFLANTHTGIDSVRARILINLANAIFYENPDTAIALTNSGLDIAVKVKFKKGEASAWRQKGLIYYYKSDFLNSIESSLTALKKGTVLHNKGFDGSVYINLGNVYADLGKLIDALDYYQKGLACVKEAGDQDLEMKALADIASIYMELDKKDSATKYFNQSLAMAKSLQDDNSICTIYNDMGVLLKREGHLDSAMKLLQTARQIAKQNKNNYMEGEILQNMSEIFLLKGNAVKAINKADSALQYTKASGAIILQKEGWETLSNAYEKQNNLKAALHAYKQFMVLKDSAENDDKKKEIMRKEMQYNFEIKEDSLKADEEKKSILAAAEIKRQSTIKKSIVWGTSILLVAAIISFVFYKKRRDAQFESEITDTEMKALRAQMNPHFIFNSLNSIGDYISKNNLQAADNYLTKFAKLMRSILENSEQKEVPLSEDLKALELYMQLESLRLNNKFAYEIKVDPDIDKENTLIPPLILQPFVENSIWHGIAKKEGNGKILVHIEKQGDMINCIVEDDGVGRMKTTAIDNEEKESFKKSLGMKITKSRIDIINKIKKSNASVELSDLSEGLRAEVKLPLQLSF